MEPSLYLHHAHVVNDNVNSVIKAENSMRDISMRVVAEPVSKPITHFAAEKHSGHTCLSVSCIIYLH